MTRRVSACRTPLGHYYGECFWPNISLDGGDLISAAPGSGKIVLFDLIACDRFGIKGKGAGEWLKSRGLEMPDINRMASIGKGFDLVRLGSEDFLLLPGTGSQPDSLSMLRADWEATVDTPKGFNAWRDEVWAWFHICGEDVSRLLASTCPVDLDGDRFAMFSVAQTRVAHIDCIVVRSDRAARLGFDLFFDIASSHFVLSALKDLGAESRLD